MRLSKVLFGALGAVLMVGAAFGVNISGTNSQNEYSIFKVGFMRISTLDAVTAFAGGGQTSAVQIADAYTRVTTVATGGDSVKLPSCKTGASNTNLGGNTTGMKLVITNAAAANSMNVFPATGEAINALSANAAYAMAANKTAEFLCSPGAGIWYSILGG